MTRNVRSYIISQGYNYNDQLIGSHMTLYQELITDQLML